MQRRASIPIDGFYDRWLWLAKRLLPVLAGVLLLTLVLLPVFGTREFSFMLDKNRVAVSHDRLQLIRPVYQGTDSQGQRFIIEAERAVQRTSADPTVELQGLNARLDSANGVAEVSAPIGDYDLKTERLTVRGSLTVSRADGYHFETAMAEVDLKARTAMSHNGVSGRAPMGNFRADSFELNIDTGRVVFSGNTHVHFDGRS